MSLVFDDRFFLGGEEPTEAEWQTEKKAQINVCVNK